MKPERFENLLLHRLKRRSFLGALGIAAATPLISKAGWAALKETIDPPFKEIPHRISKHHKISEGYNVQTLMRWGDRVTADSTEFDPYNQSPEKQEKQFGFNCDFTAFMPLPKGSDNSNHGLLCVNHEYTNKKHMFSKDSILTDGQKHKVEQAATGISIVEIKNVNGKWNVVRGKYNRRISALSTDIKMSGPAAGHEALRTQSDPRGANVIGTLNNCSGGVTPWGTVLSSEENTDDYFDGTYSWHKTDARFDVKHEPNEPNRFGWIVEYDPYDPESKPVKRTALGKFKHETATVALTKNNRVVIYSGDDEIYQHIYKFVSDKSFYKNSLEKNKNILDSGTLFVAKFFKNGKCKWLPLIYGKNGLDSTNDFFSQADILINPRKAAKILGATEMDRPEGISIQPKTNRVYVAMTNNKKRKKPGIANRRKKNIHGHILELIPPGQDHGSDEFFWASFMLAGNPNNKDDLSYYIREPSLHGWLSCPDNLANDPSGRLWITTDGQPKTIKSADAIFMVNTEGSDRGRPYHLFNAPTGAEVTGPSFTPDGKNMFISIQHPAEDKGSNFDKPSTLWPDFKDDMPARPSVIVITKDDNGVIGS